MLGNARSETNRRKKRFGRRVAENNPRCYQNTDGINTKAAKSDY